VPKCKKGTRIYVPFGDSLSSMEIPVITNLRTKFKVFSVPCSKDMEGYPKFANRDVMGHSKLFMAILWNRAGHYIFALRFLLLTSSFFFSSSNLSRRRLDVCHTSTHDVALERIYDAGLKCAARGSLKIQDAKMTPKIAIWAPSHNFVGLYLRN